MIKDFCPESNQGSLAAPNDLLENEVLEVSKELICRLGLKEALIFTKIRTWSKSEAIQGIAALKQTFPYWSEKTFRRIIQKLEKQGLVFFGNIEALEVVKLLCQKKPQHLDGASLTCEWCKSTTVILHEHHYPVPKSKGGNETVKICPNCHYEFHYLTQTRIFQAVQVNENKV